MSELDSGFKNSQIVIQPTLTLLNQEQMVEVHEVSLRILSSVGIRIDSPAARQLLARASGTGTAAGTTMGEGGLVRIPRELVEWALQAAPSSVEIYNRRAPSGEPATPAFRLPGETRFGIGVTALYYQDPETDQVTPFTREHLASTVRLGHGLSSFDVVSTVGIVQDVEPEVADLYATLEMTANTTKPLVILISDEDAFPAVLDLLEHLHGDLARQPSVIPYLNPISPLLINNGTVDKMLVTIERGLPFIYSNYGMAGASTPITPAGMLILLNAELLAGLTLSQLIREGTPVILGSLPAFFDMKGIGTFYDPRSYLVDLACAEMMAHYGLPHCGTSGSGMGWGPDLIAAGHQWTNHLLSCLGKVGLAPFVGDDLGSMAFSPAIAVYADEVIQQARLIAAGFALDRSSAILEEIAQVGPGGNFFMTDQTVKLFRTAQFRSKILPNMALEEWQAKNCPHAQDVLKRHTRELLQALQPPQGCAEVMERGEAFITRGISKPRRRA